MAASVTTFHRHSTRLNAAIEKPWALSQPETWIVSLAAVAAMVKLMISYSTFGTNDAMTFYGFARSLSDHGLEWTYRHGVVWLSSSSVFNHPPLTAYFLRGIYHLSQIDSLRTNGITFPFMLRLPGILADFGTVLIVLALVKRAGLLRSHRWAMVLFAVSPVSIMVSGFHGNTDPVMVFFLIAASYMAVREQPIGCGLFFALSCQVKIVPLLLFPIFLLFWWHRRTITSFLAPMMVVFLCLWWEPLTQFPMLFVKNVLSYGSYWGLWGITYWLRLTGSPEFSNIWYENFSLGQKVIVSCLKLLFLVCILVIAWRRRTLDGRALMESVALAWIVFFVFSPGVCAQYLVWPAPFILFLSARFYGWITAASSVFLFFFYNVISHGLPWYVGISTNQLNTVWTPWTVWPWAVLIIGMIVLWRKAVAADPGLQLFSLAPLSGDVRGSRSPLFDNSSACQRV